MIRKLTFNSSNVTSNDDSVLYKALGAGDRILKGCEITNTTNEIYIGSGYLSVYGRQIKVEGTETVEVPAAVVATPYSFVLEIDMDNDAQEFKAITSEPVQDDISGGTGVYQMLIATFTMGTEGIEDYNEITQRGGMGAVSFINKTVAPSDFEADETYGDFGYKADIQVPGTTMGDFATVIFSPEDSYMFAPVCLSLQDSVRIYSNEIPQNTITIPTIVIQKVSEVTA